MPTETDSVLTTMLTDVAKLAAAAEEIFAAAARRSPVTNQEPHLTAQERSILRLAGFEDNEVNPEVNRLRSVHRHMEQAGSDLQLAELSAAADQAREAFDQQGPALKAAIEAARLQLAELEAAARAADQEVARRRQARETLRDPRVLPRHIRESLRDHQLGVANPITALLQQVETEINLCESVQGFEAVSSEARNVVQARRLEECYRVQKQRDGSTTYVDAVQWSAFQRKCRESLPALRRERERLAEELVAVEALEPSLTDHYIRQLN